MEVKCPWTHVGRLAGRGRGPVLIALVPLAAAACTVPHAIEKQPAKEEVLAMADYGPKPVLEAIKPEAEEQILATLEIPETAQIRWGDWWEACWWKDSFGPAPAEAYHFAWRVPVWVRSETASAGFTKERRSWVYCRGAEVLWVTLPKEKARIVRVSAPRRGAGTEPGEDDSRSCAACETEVDASARFCPSCGEPLGQ